MPRGKQPIVKYTLEGKEVKVYTKMITACHENKISYAFMRKELAGGGFLFFKGYKYGKQLDAR